MSSRIQLIAIDVDGTLVRPDQTVPADVVAAVAEATAAGVRICLATGRSLIETLPAWRQLNLPTPYEPIILIGGAQVSEPHTGRTLYEHPIPHDVAVAFSDALAHWGHSAMAIVDEWRWNLDYLVVPRNDIREVEKNFFGQMNQPRVQKVEQFAANGPPILRLNTMVHPDEAKDIEAALLEQFGEVMNLHAIHAPNYGITFVEAFTKQCNKWTAVQYVAQAHRIGGGSIATIGDDVNDIPMLKGAGIGVAMPQAAPHVQAAADCIAHGGLGVAIREVLALQQ